MMKLSALAVSITVVSVSAIAGVNPDELDLNRINNELPYVPVSELQNPTVSTGGRLVAKPADTTKTESVKPIVTAEVKTPAVDPEPTAEKTNVLTLKKGQNELVVVAVGHTNRFELPFAEPVIVTSSTDDMPVVENVLYLSTTSENQPISAFIHDKSNPQNAMSVTFIPKRVPPVDYVLKFEGSEQMTMGSYRKAEAWEQSSSYVETLKELMKSVAIGETPQGYSLNVTPNLSDFYGCMQPGLNFDFSRAQRIEGAAMSVIIGVATNNSEQELEFNEPSCAAPNVRAVAAWPKPLLNPTEASEVYVVISRPVELVPSDRKRPSLVGY